MNSLLDELIDMMKKHCI